MLEAIGFGARSRKGNEPLQPGVAWPRKLMTSAFRFAGRRRRQAQPLDLESARRFKRVKAQRDDFPTQSHISAARRVRPAEINTVAFVVARAAIYVQPRAADDRLLGRHVERDFGPALRPLPSHVELRIVADRLPA